MLKKLNELINRIRLWWKRERCFVNMEYEGCACFGLCNGWSIWGDGKPELEELCKGCKHLYKATEG